MQNVKLKSKSLSTTNVPSRQMIPNADEQTPKMPQPCSWREIVGQDGSPGSSLRQNGFLPWSQSLVCPWKLSPPGSKYCKHNHNHKLHKPGVWAAGPSPKAAHTGEGHSAGCGWVHGKSRQFVKIEIFWIVLTSTWIICMVGMCLPIIHDSTSSQANPRSCHTPENSW